MKDLQPNILADYEHRVNRVIDTHEGQEGFPQIDSYHITKEDLSSYLFDYQAILDSEGTVRSQQTVYGLIALIPILVLSAFPLSSLPWKSNVTSLLVGIAIGMAVALVIKALRVTIKRYRLNRLKAENPDIVAYVDDVMKFEN